MYGTDTDGWARLPVHNLYSLCSLYLLQFKANKAMKPKFFPPTDFISFPSLLVAFSTCLPDSPSPWLHCSSQSRSRSSCFPLGVKESVVQCDACSATNARRIGQNNKKKGQLGAGVGGSLQPEVWNTGAGPYSDLTWHFLSVPQPLLLRLAAEDLNLEVDLFFQLTCCL